MVNMINHFLFKSSMFYQFIETFINMIKELQIVFLNKSLKRLPILATGT